MTAKKCKSRTRPGEVCQLMRQEEEEGEEEKRAKIRRNLIHAIKDRAYRKVESIGREESSFTNFPNS